MDMHGEDLPVDKASSRTSSSPGCRMFQEVLGRTASSSREASCTMSMWLLPCWYRGMKQTLPCWKMSWTMAAVSTSSGMLRKMETLLALWY